MANLIRLTSRATAAVGRSFAGGVPSPLVVSVTTGRSQPAAATTTRLFAASTDEKDFVSKNAIVKSIAKQHDMTQVMAGQVVDSVFDAITESLVEGKKVRINLFGKFEPYVQKARTFNTPQGGTVAVPDRKKVRFTPFKNLKETVEES